MSAAGEDLKLLIRSWMNENPSARTTSSLARKSGLDYNTTMRASNGGNPECQTVLALLNVICSKNVALEYLRKHFPHAARFHERELANPGFNDAESLKPIIGQYLSFVLLSLAYGGFASRSYIQKSFGDMGLDAAQALVNSGRFHWSNDSMLTPRGPEEFFQFQAKEDVVNACQHIVTLSAGSNGWPVALIGTLNDDEHLKFRRLIQEFCAATKELVYSSNGDGTNLVALATVYVSLLNGEAAK